MRLVDGCMVVIGCWSYSGLSLWLVLVAYPSGCKWLVQVDIPCIWLRATHGVVGCYQLVGVKCVISGLSSVVANAGPLLPLILISVLLLSILLSILLSMPDRCFYLLFSCFCFHQFLLDFDHSCLNISWLMSRPFLPPACRYFGQFFCQYFCLFCYQYFCHYFSWNNAS